MCSFRSICRITSLSSGVIWMVAGLARGVRYGGQAVAVLWPIVGALGPRPGDVGRAPQRACLPVDDALCDALRVLRPGAVRLLPAGQPLLGAGQEAGVHVMHLGHV